MMEQGKCVSDPHEEVRKLQEKVRELELQLSQKASSAPRNGLSDASSKSNGGHVDVNEDLVPVYDVDVSSRTWLVRGPGALDPRHDEEVFAALRREGARVERTLYSALCNAEQDRKKNIDSRTFTRPKKRMGRPSLELFESIATISQPGEPKLLWALEANDEELDNMTCSLLESSLINSVYSETSSSIDIISQLSFSNKKQKVASNVELRRGSLVISDRSDSNTDLSCNARVNEKITSSHKFENGNTLGKNVGSSSHLTIEALTSNVDVSEPEDGNATLMESVDLSSGLVDSALLDGNLIDTVVILDKSKQPISKTHQLNKTFTPSPPPNVDVSSQKARNLASDLNHSVNENLNRTFTKDEDESPVTCPSMNSAFLLGSNGSSGGHCGLPPSVRPGSTDSALDDDQLSSTSDSSHTSTTRLMNVGDVQHLAQLQEQSLVMSTPLHRNYRKDSCGDNLSPIMRLPGSDVARLGNLCDIQTGYGSDHSSRSPLSSLHSSPAGSPFGSSTALPGSNLNHPQDPRMTHRPNGLLQRKNTYGLIPPPKTKVGSIRPPAPVLAPTQVQAHTSAPAHVSRSTTRSGLRPPMIRSNAAARSSSGLPRPAGTGIPRPSSQSRIPPPKVRTTASQPSRKEWTDECY